MKRTTRSRKGEDGSRFSIKVLKLLGMVMTADVRIVIRNNRPAKEGESVLMRGGSSSAV